MGKDFQIHFTKEDAQRVDKQMKQRLASLGIRDMQIKTTIRYHCIPKRMAKIRKTDPSSEKKEVERCHGAHGSAQLYSN